MVFGSGGGMVSQNQSAVIDEQGNAIVNASNDFGVSPAGIALLTQSLFGLPNGTLSLTPPDVYSPIGPDNHVPYWQFEDYSNGVMSGSAIYDSTTKTWGVIIAPGSAVSGDYCTFTTRSYLVNDDNLGLRQKATTVIAKSGTAAGSTQWNLTLTATYADSIGATLTTTTIGTALDTGTWTSISGFTTAGGSAISASAKYVDLEYKLTATASVTGSATVTIKSLFLATKIGANASFNVADVYTANATWTRPTGVDYVTVVAVGGGGGGAGGAVMYKAPTTGGTARYMTGSSGGGGSRVAYLPNLYVGDQTSISCGVGSGGSGGTAKVFGKNSGSGNSDQGGTNGSIGGATTFGSYLSIPGGGGGIGGTSYVGGSGTAGAQPGPAGGSAAGAATIAIYGSTDSAGGSGAGAGSASRISDAYNAAFSAGTSSIAGITLLPFTAASYSAAGAAGGAGVNSPSPGTSFVSASGTVGAGGGTGFIAGGGASGGYGQDNSSNPTVFIGNSSAGASGGAGGGGASQAVAYRRQSSGGTVTVTGGAGGAGGAYSGAGGGGGGLAVYQAELASSIPGTVTSGAGGQGGGGIIVVAYTA